MKRTAVRLADIVSDTARTRTRVLEYWILSIIIIPGRQEEFLRPITGTITFFTAVRLVIYSFFVVGWGFYHGDNSWSRTLYGIDARCRWRKDGQGHGLSQQGEDRKYIWEIDFWYVRLWTRHRQKSAESNSARCATTSSDSNCLVSRFAPFLIPTELLLHKPSDHTAFLIETLKYMRKDVRN